MSSDPPPPPEVKIPTKAFWGELLLLVAIFFVSAPAPPPAVNEPHYLCRLRHSVDESYCPGDLFLESPDAHYTFVWTLAWMTRFFSFETIAWLGRIGCWTGLAWAWLRLSWRIVPRPLFASLGAGLVISAIAEGNFAGEWLVGGFEAKTVAYIFVLLGLTSWLDNRWNWTWTYFGLASAWHALVGGWSVLILITLWLLFYWRERPFRSMLPGLALGGTIALAGVLPALALSVDASPEVRREAAEIYVFERLAHHLAPLHKPPEWIAHRATKHSIIVLFLVGMLVWHRYEAGASWRFLHGTAVGKIVQYAAGAMALAMIGLLIEAILWHDQTSAAGWLRYYWFRLVDVAVPMAIAALVIKQLDTTIRREDRLSPAFLMIALFVAGYPISERYLGFIQTRSAVADKKVHNAEDWIDACRWIEENTARNAMFLTPRGNSSFKWYAQRAEVVTYKDVPQDAQNLVEWKRRLYDVFSYEEDGQQKMANRFGLLGTKRVDELTKTYQVNYILDQYHPPLRYPIVYMNDTYVVYQVGARQPSPSSNNPEQ